MFEGIMNFFKKLKKQEKEQPKSKDTAKERLQLVLVQDRANVSADFLDLMKQEIIEVIKKYIDVDENSINVILTNQTNEDGTTGAPSLYASIPIVNIKDVKNKVPNDSKNEEIKVQEETKEEETSPIEEEKKEEVASVQEEKTENEHEEKQDKVEEIGEEVEEQKEEDLKENTEEKPKETTNN